MATYFSPGVYVKEIPSGSAPIAGAGTSTAAFIGVISDKITIPTAPIYTQEDTIPLYPANSSKKEFDWNDVSATIKPDNEHLQLGNWEIWLENTDTTKELHDKGYGFNTGESEKVTITSESNVKIIFTLPPAKKIHIKYQVLANKVTNEEVFKLEVCSETDAGSKTTRQIKDLTPSKEVELKSYPINQNSGTYQIKINGCIITGTSITLEPDQTTTKSKLVLDKSKLEEFINSSLKGVIRDGTAIITVDYQVLFPKFAPSTENEVKLCTNFNEFKKHFGDFSTDLYQNKLAHAVYGFFNNGGTRCYVVRVKPKTDINKALENLEAIDDIAIVAAPGITDVASRSAIITHCQQRTGNRFAILDCDKKEEIRTIKMPVNSSYAAFYYPWIQVLDPATKIMKKKQENDLEEGIIYVPPSGHIAGLYARVDAQRGVHKAPANEVILGALGLEKNISKNQQDGLNPQGINCIRNLNGNIRVWGARTIGGDANLEFKYINVRRVFNYLKKSIDQGTQWTVFEPNSPELWAKIRRNVTAFLTIAWRDGALFGSTPEQAFYVKCDEETNPIDQRDLGQVITQIGVSIVKPAEFVIFNLSQWAGPGK